MLLNGGFTDSRRKTMTGERLCKLLLKIKSFCSRRKREADGFIRGIIVSNQISREDAAAIFEIGRYRYDRLRKLNPNLPIPSSNSRPAYHS